LIVSEHDITSDGRKKENEEEVNGIDKVENARILIIPSLYRSDFLANC
jgi:hypothetical protein